MYGWTSWSGPASDADIEAERRRERRRRYVRMHSITVVVVVVVADIGAIIATSAVQSVMEARAGRPCATFWADLSDQAVSGIWTTLAVLGAILLLCAWRRWVFLPALVVQLIAVAILVPPQVHDHTYFGDVAAGRIPVTEADSGGLACDT